MFFQNKYHLSVLQQRTMNILLSLLEDLIISRNIVISMPKLRRRKYVCQVKSLRRLSTYDDVYDVITLLN